MAQWSELWKQDGWTRKEKSSAVSIARFTPPTVRKAKPGGKYPHLQPAK